MIQIDDAKFISNVGKTIRDFREARGLTQAQLGSIIGISQSGLAKIEAGHVSINISHLRTVALLCRMKVSDLIKRAEAEEVFWQQNDPSEPEPAE